MIGDQMHLQSWTNGQVLVRLSNKANAIIETLSFLWNCDVETGLLRQHVLQLTRTLRRSMQHYENRSRKVSRQQREQLCKGFDASRKRRSQRCRGYLVSVG